MTQTIAVVNTEAASSAASGCERITDSSSSDNSILPTPKAPGFSQDSDAAGGSSLSPSATPVQRPEDTARKRRLDLGIQTLRELKEMRGKSEGRYVVEDLISEASVNIVGGDSGLGKSPLCYQMAFCVCLGLPFLGRNVRRGRVIYCDLENGPQDIDQLTTAVGRFLGSIPGDDLMIVTDHGRANKVSQLSIMLATVAGVRLVIIDSLRAFEPKAETKNEIAGTMLNELRALAKKYNTAFVLVHHLRKPSQEAPPLPSNARVIERLNALSGCKSLTNQTDCRILFSEGRQEEIALTMEGNRRLHGDFGPFHVERVFDEKSGEPLGYRTMTGASLLFNSEMENTWAALPTHELRRKDIRLAYGKGDSATQNFIKKCLELRILKKLESGAYQKVVSGGGPQLTAVRAGLTPTPIPTDIFAVTQGASRRRGRQRVI